MNPIVCKNYDRVCSTRLIPLRLTLLSESLLLKLIKLLKVTGGLKVNTTWAKSLNLLSFTLKDMSVQIHIRYPSFDLKIESTLQKLKLNGVSTKD